MKISSVILTKNEEYHIKACLDSLKWCDEVLVIDDVSADNTLKIAQKYGAKTYSRRLESDFSQQRNFALQKAKGDWVLFVDADERVTHGLKNEILNKVKQKNNHVNGYYLKRLDKIWGRDLKHGESGKVKLLRLAKRKNGRWERPVHEVWNVNGEIGELKNPLIHFAHSSLSGFIKDVNYYSTLHAQSKYKSGERSSLIKIIFWPIFKFIDNQVFKVGMLDGTQGFLVSLMMSLHSFLAWSKLWLRQYKESKR